MVDKPELGIFDDLLSLEDQSFQSWIRDQNLTDLEKQILCSHYWMREITSLSSSTIVDYREDVAVNFDLVGRDTANLSVKSQERSELNKFQDFQECDVREALL